MVSTSRCLYNNKVYTLHMLYVHHGTVKALLHHSKMRKQIYLWLTNLRTEGKEQGKNRELDMKASAQIWHIYLQSHVIAQSNSYDNVKSQCCWKTNPPAETGPTGTSNTHLDNNTINPNLVINIHFALI